MELIEPEGIIGALSDVDSIIQDFSKEAKS